LGRTAYMAALPGLGLLAVMLSLALGRAAPGRMVAAQMLMPVAALAASAVLSGGASALAAVAIAPSGPPLMPLVTGLTSVLAVLVYTGALVSALALALPAALPRLFGARR